MRCKLIEHDQKVPSESETDENSRKLQNKWKMFIVFGSNSKAEIRSFVNFDIAVAIKFSIAFAILLEMAYNK